MAAQRRIDLVLDSVKRLLRIGATANLLNLLQKQHPADLAQEPLEACYRGGDDPAAAGRQGPTACTPPMLV